MTNAKKIFYIYRLYLYRIYIYRYVQVVLHRKRSAVKTCVFREPVYTYGAVLRLSRRVLVHARTVLFPSNPRVRDRFRVSDPSSRRVANGLRLPLERRPSFVSVFAQGVNISPR